MDNWQTTLSAFTLTASVAASVLPAAAGIITIHASGNVVGQPFVTTSGTFIQPPIGGTYFGLPGALDGAFAEAVWTIDVGQLGAYSNVNGANTALWSYADPDLAIVQPTITSAIPIGITGYLTINGITLSTGIDRHFLLLYDNEAGQDSVVTYTNTLTTIVRTPTFRDWIDIDLHNFGNSFVSSLNPYDLVGLAFSCSAENGDFGNIQFRHVERLTGSPRYTSGYVDLCAAGSHVSVTGEVPEPSTIALIAMALLSLFGFGMTRRRADT